MAASANVETTSQNCGLRCRSTKGKENQMITYPASGALAVEFAERVRNNQTRLTSALKPHYDFIVCGSGSSGSVVARRLAENADVGVLLLEVGGDDDVPEVMEPGKWIMNLGSERERGFVATPNP